MKQFVKGFSLALFSLNILQPFLSNFGYYDLMMSVLNGAGDTNHSKELVSPQVFHYRHDITEILLKVALNIINLTLKFF
jgi:hypothetical protein